MSRPDLSLGDTRLIIETAEKAGVLRAQLAYILATTFWETNRTMQPVREAYWLSENWRKNNLRYYPWYGRGYVQLTWEQNYRRAGKELGVDLTTDADAVMEPAIAARILVTGMLEGWFTGKQLDHYITARKTDFVGARRIVNGTDQAKAIAQIAEEYLVVLNELGLGKGPALDYTTRPTLHIGMVSVRREDVRLYQIDMANLGYHVGAADGHFGNRTRGGTLEFEADHNLVSDGRVDGDNWRALQEAKAKPPRAHTEETLRAAGSRQITNMDDLERTTRNGSVAVGTLPAVDLALAAGSKLQEAESMLGGLQSLIVENWIALLLLGGCFFVWWYCKTKAERARGIRVEDAVTGKHLGR